MALTVYDVILNIPNIASDMRGDTVEAENGYITIVTNVSASLPVHTDFELNGEVLVSGKRTDVLQKYGNILVEELVDFRTKNVKILWSNEKIDPMDESAIFKIQLAARLLSVDGTDDLLNFTALRNKYGSSLVTLTYQKPKR